MRYFVNIRSAIPLLIILLSGCDFPATVEKETRSYEITRIHHWQETETSGGNYFGTSMTTVSLNSWSKSSDTVDYYAFDLYDEKNNLKFTKVGKEKAPCNLNRLKVGTRWLLDTTVRNYEDRKVRYSIDTWGLCRV